MHALFPRCYNAVNILKAFLCSTLPITTTLSLYQYNVINNNNAYRTKTPIPQLFVNNDYFGKGPDRNNCRIYIFRH